MGGPSWVGFSLWLHDFSFLALWLRKNCHHKLFELVEKHWGACRLLSKPSSSACQCATAFRLGVVDSFNLGPLRSVLCFSRQATETHCLEASKCLKAAPVMIKPLLASIPTWVRQKSNTKRKHRLSLHQWANYIWFSSQEIFSTTTWYLLNCQSSWFPKGTLSYKKCTQRSASSTASKGTSARGCVNLWSTPVRSWVQKGLVCVVFPQKHVNKKPNLRPLQAKKRFSTSKSSFLY